MKIGFTPPRLNEILIPRVFVLSLLATLFAVASACSTRDAGSDGGGDSPTYDERVWAERVKKGLADFDCPTTPALAVPTGSYAGPLFDTHLHMPHLPDSPIGTMPGEQDLEGFAESGYAGENLEPPPPGVIPRAGENITMSEIACTLRYEGTNAAFAYFQVFPNNQGPLVELASDPIVHKLTGFPYSLHLVLLHSCLLQR